MLNIGIIMVEELRHNLFYRSGIIYRTQSTEELNAATVEGHTEWFHLTIVHQIAQLVFIMLNLLIGLTNLHIVEHGLMIEFTFLRDITYRNCIINQPSLIIKNRMVVYFQIIVQITLRDNTLITPPILLRILLVDTFVERRHLKQIHRTKEGVAIFAVEMANLTHLAIGSQQVTFWIIE